MYNIRMTDMLTGAGNDTASLNSWRTWNILTEEVVKKYTLFQALNVDSERALRARWDAASVETIQETTKPCPHCAVKTEKSGKIYL